MIEPTSNGIGADSFALIWYKGKLYGLNGSGHSPRLISGEKLLEQGLKAVPNDGWDRQAVAAGLQAVYEGRRPRKVRGLV